MAIKAIPTEYGGYWFRSRLEARWAVFFNAIGIPFRYELQGYNLDGIKYLPDFYLPDIGQYFEVKPFPVTEREYAVMCALCTESKRSVIVAEGDPYLCPTRDYHHHDWTRKGVESPYQLIEMNERSQSISGKNFYEIEHIDEQGFCTSNKRALGWKSAICLDGYGFWYPVEASAMNSKDRPVVVAAMIKARQARFEYGETPQ